MSKKNNLAKWLGVITIFFLQSCADNDFKNIESDLLGEANYLVGTYEATVKINNVVETSVKTNNLSSNLLGKYQQIPFGQKKASILSQIRLATLSPSFGSKTQATEEADNEQENETVKEVYLYIPFFSTVSSSYLSDGKIVNNYQLDSVYGNKQATFDIRVYESNYYLRDLDPTNGFSVQQNYYSDLDVQSHLGELIAEETNYSIKETAITRYRFDNPSTDEDESQNEFDVLSPGIRIALKPSFFQSKIIDKEGSEELASTSAFVNYFRGLYIETDNFSDNLMMLLDTKKAKIEIVYSYLAKNETATNEMTERFELNFLNNSTSSTGETIYTGITVNLFNRTNDAVSASSSGNADRIYLSGVLGHLAELTLFEDTQLETLRLQNILVTDALLKIYVDQSAGIEKNPYSLYIYNAETGEPLIDYTTDVSANASNPSLSRGIHLGRLKKDDDGNLFYEIRITKHIANLLSNNQATNFKLGLGVASNVNIVTATDYYDSANDSKKTSVTTLSNPLGTVIYGNTTNVDESKRLKLIINYAKMK